MTSGNMIVRFLICSFALVLLYPAGIDMYLVGLPEIASGLNASESQLHIAFSLYLVGMALAMFFAASGLLPFSCSWPKAVRVKSAIDIGAWWLAAAILVAGFIATIAFGRLFLLCFWRPAASAGQPSSPAPSSPALPSVVPLVGLTLLVVFFGLFPESLLSLSQQAAVGLGDPQAYIQSVFSQGGKP